MVVARMICVGGRGNTKSSKVFLYSSRCAFFSGAMSVFAPLLCASTSLLLFNFVNRICWICSVLR